MYLACKEENSAGTDQTGLMLQKQAEELTHLRAKCQELERREVICERKWTDLIKENELNCQQVASYRATVEKQRKTYSKLLEATEQRVINSNLVVVN